MICAKCNTQFEPISKSQIYCSSKCRGLAWYHKHHGAKSKTHVCEQCGEEFVHKYKCVRFCSKKCGLKNSRDKRREEYRELDREYYHKNRHKQLETQRRYRERSSINQKRTRRGDLAFSVIRQRCMNTNNKSYKYYGAKGVECRLTKEEFRSIYFSTDNCENCGKKLSDENRRVGKDSRTIDRIDSNGHYEANNVQIICRSCQTRKMNASRKR